ncbi:MULTISPECIES: TetR/AcrR family transcriptional regulator [Arthrobacter]|uniref:TetR/AcrR family transcriptional regulator n=1 Tax=Arthrobacter TaxID=1663 RepID=UPI00082404BE|nr:MULTISPECIES: TetR/AcrR family transcriptional regulator [Arthrobacter]PSS44830.1 TetR/AcrR family transcriptional regulator [Arthrobacter woluwensis]
MEPSTVNSRQQVDRQSRILDAVLELLSRHGISGVNMRAVAREAGVALGLVNYYYADKPSLIRAVLGRISESDLRLVAPDPEASPDEQLRTALRRVAAPEILTTQYLSLRLHLWALAQADEEFAAINAEAFDRYLDGLAELISKAKPTLTPAQCKDRAADVVVVQNGMWLTSLLGIDPSSIERSILRTEEIAFAD